MQLPLQRAVLLVLGALVPVLAYAVARADLLVAVAAVNVFLIFASLRIATGGSDRFDENGTDHDARGSS